jgi:hypothetical protein
MKTKFIRIVLCPVFMCCIAHMAFAHIPFSSSGSLLLNNNNKSFAVISAGYIKATASGGSFQACSEASSAVTMQIYSTGGQIIVGNILYTDAAGTQVFNGNFNWYSYSATYAGAIAGSISVWPDGTIHDYVACTVSGGGGGGVAGNWSISSNVGTNGGYKIKPAILRDLSGYAIQDRGKPSQFFDGFNEVDPANGIINFIGNAGTTYGLPNKQDLKYYPQGNVIGQGNATTYYPGNRGVRIIFDMTGSKDMNDTTKKVKLTSIYAAEDYTDAGDTLYFYNFDLAFRSAPAQRWWYLARPDSLLTPFLKIVGSGATRTWKSYLLNDSMRYIMVRAVLRDHGSYKTAPGFSELVMYGKRLFDSTALNKRTDVYSGVLPSKKKATQTFDKSVGTNLGQGFDTLQLQYDGLIRIYGSKNYWATQTITGVPGAEQYKFDNFSDIGPKQYAAFKRAGTKFWWSIRGESAWYASKYGSARIDIDSYGLEPEVPFNYKRESDFYYNYAAKFGSVAIPAGNTRWTGDAGYPNGLNLINYVEAGNEDEYSVTPLTSDAHTAACYDGAQGNLGLSGRTGVKSADPSFRLIYPGTGEQDSQRVDNYAWLSKITRTDNKVAIDAFNFHHYLRNTNRLNREFLCSDFVGAHGQSAELDSTLYYNTVFAKAVYNYCDNDTTKEIFNTENGLSNWGHESYDELYACNVVYDIGNMGKITIPGLDSLQSKAVLMSRFEMITNASPITGYNEFFFHNASYGANNFILFSSYGRITGRDPNTYKALTFFPWWYYRAGLYSSLKGFYPDAVLSSAGTGLWVIKYRNAVTPDSVCYAIWKGSYDGSSLPNQVISVGNITGSAIKTTMSFTSILTSATAVPISNGSITVIATELPALYFVSEKPVVVLQPPVVNAGLDNTIVLPANSANLNGSAVAGPGATIVSYLWTKLSGPSAYTISNNTTAATSISNLSQGTYSFQLTAKDNNNMSASDTVLVTVAPPVNIAPIASAGPDVSITVNNVLLNAWGTYDPDGTIAAYQWTKITGPASFTIANGNSATPTISGLVSGVYSFRLMVTDNLGATGSDTVNVTVNLNSTGTNLPPVAMAGPDVSITANSVLLNAWGTNDPDGSIASYLWTKIAGPSSCTITNGIYATPTMSNLVTGVYSFRLVVTDNMGATGSDTVNVTVNLNSTGTNLPPVAMAGPDVSITTSSIILNAWGTYDPDGTIAAYQWTNIAGPASCTITNGIYSTPTVTNLVNGLYSFRLMVTDNLGATASDTVNVTVSFPLGASSGRITPSNTGTDNTVYIPGPGLLRAFPNPITGNSISIEMNNDYIGNLQFNFCDVNGKVLKRIQQFKAGKAFNNTLQLPVILPGTYWLYIQREGNIKPFIYLLIKQ